MAERHFPLLLCCEKLPGKVQALHRTICFRKEQIALMADENLNFRRFLRSAAAQKRGNT